MPELGLTDTEWDSLLSALFNHYWQDLLKISSKAHSDTTEGQTTAPNI
jgi:hypothetical protein